MSDTNRYTTVSLHKDIKETLESLKADDETYNDVMRRSLASLEDQQQKTEDRWEWQNQLMHSMARLQVRMAAEMGLEKGQIPQNQAEYESWGGYSPFAVVASGEETTDVYSREKEARFQAHEELVEEREIDLDEESQLHGHGRVAEEKIEERAAEIMAERATDDEGYMDSFDDSDDNGGDH